jgi:hypothetical protein
MLRLARFVFDGLDTNQAFGNAPLSKIGPQFIDVRIFDRLT